MPVDGVVQEPEQRPGTAAADVGDLTEAEARLQASLESYRTIFELASDAIFVHDIETGAILDANQKACELHGRTVEELRAGGVGSISAGEAPFDAENARAYVRRAAEGEPQRFEWQVVRDRGERFWVEVSLHRVRILGEDRVLASVRNIDERKRAEEALSRAYDELDRRVAERTAELEQRSAELARAEERFRAIVEASPTPLLLSRVKDGRILYANDRLEALIGVPEGSLADRTTPEFYFDPDDRPAVLAQVMEHGYIRDRELRIRRADGAARWVSLSVQRLDVGGETVLATALIDITERKEAEAALRASEESYRGLFDGLTELVYVQDLDGRFLNVNEAVLRAYGYAREELVGQTPALLAATDRVDVETTLAHFRAAADGEPQRFDWWGRRKDGSVFPKEVVLMRSTYFGRDVVIAVARDISDRVNAEAALRRSEEHFRRLIENASDLITIMGTEGTIRYQSPAVMPLLGYTQEELLDRNAFDYIAPEDVRPTMERWERLIEQPGTPVAAEFRFLHKDGSWRFMEGIGATLSPDSVADGVVVNARDITERKRAEATLRLQKTLLEAQQEASIDGILVVSDEGAIISYNQRFVEMWGIPAGVVASGQDDDAIQAVLDQVQDPAAFIARIEHLYAHPHETARDEIALRDGRVLDRYAAPVVSNEGDYYGRIWFFRDVTAERRYAENLDRARRDAEHAREDANRYAASLEREFEFGRKIQRGLFPASLPQPRGWEIAVRFQPVWHVAGDFYDAFELPTGRLGLLIADVSGKGVGAALFMALFQSLLRAHTERASADAPDRQPPDEEILRGAIGHTNAYIGRVHRHAHMFASVFFALLDPVTGTMSYVNAGHDPPAILRPGRPVERLVPTGPALGLLTDAAFGVARTTLAPENTLLAFTDGVTEARNAGGDFFTESRLLELLDEDCPTAAGLLDRIVRAMRDFSGGTTPADDVTVLALRRHR